MKYAICLRSRYPYVTEGFRYEVIEYEKSMDIYPDLLKIKCDTGRVIVLHAFGFRFSDT